MIPAQINYFELKNQPKNIKMSMLTKMIGIEQIAHFTFFEQDSKAVSVTGFFLTGFLLAHKINRKKG